MKKRKTKVSVKEYAELHNPRLNRRGKRMSMSYIYRLIRKDIKKAGGPSLWFEYVLEGEQDHIYIII